ncbi:MAG: hypothetical protein ACO2Y6_04470 [Ilumatobacteraceae bacterium]
MKQRGIALALIAFAGAIIAVVAVVSGGDEPEFQTIANSEDADYEYIMGNGFRFFHTDRSLVAVVG